MSSITNLFNALQRLFGQHDPSNRDLLLLLALIIAITALIRTFGIKSRVGMSGSKSNTDRERIQGLGLRVDDIAARVATEVTNHERQLQVLLTKVDVFEQQLKKFKSSGGNLIFEFETGENLEDRVEYLEALLLDLREQGVSALNDRDFRGDESPLQLEDPDVPTARPTEIRTPIADLLREAREQLSKQLSDIVGTYKNTTEFSLKAISELLKTHGFNESIANHVVGTMKENLAPGETLEPQKLLELFGKSLRSLLHKVETKEKRARGEEAHPHVMLIAGMNGANRIEISQQIAERIAHSGAKPLVTTCEPLDAELRDQLVRWGRQTEVPLVLGSKRTKPVALTCKAVHTAQDNNFDVLIIDTVSGIEANAKIVEQLRGISAMVNREQPDVPFDTLMVIDAAKAPTVLAQVRELRDSVGVTGLCLINLSTAKAAGTLATIENEAGIPIRYLSFNSGERTIREFSPQELVDAICKG